MDTPITMTLASLNTMDVAARQVADKLMALRKALFHPFDFLYEDIPTFTFIMTRKELRRHMKQNGYKKYVITEELFPRKKKRGTMRRARIERKWGKFNDPPLPDGVYIDEWLGENDPHSVTDIDYDNDSIRRAIFAHSLSAQDLKVGYRRTTNQIFDDFDPPMIPPVSRKIDITDDEFDGDPVLIIPGPFDGEEES